MYRGLIIIFVVAVLLTGCANTDKDSNINKETLTTDSNDSIPGKIIIIESITHPTGNYFPSDVVAIGMVASNLAKETKTIWVELQISDHIDAVVYTKIEELKLIGESTENKLLQNLYWTVPSTILSGNYKTKITIWDMQPSNEQANIIKQSKSETGFMCYQKQENFDSWNGEIWKTSDKKLGRTRLKSEHVSVLEGMLQIKMPAGKLESGEVSTIEKVGYGAFEIRMKLPMAPSSITGFFLYESPDFYYEIDIELYNDTTGKMLLTTYADGKVRNENSTKISFDPTKEFHDYRIEYYENKVEFYIDNQFVKGLSEGFPKGQMRLMVNSWYPDWLKGTPAESDQSLFIDWIRY